MQYHKELKRAVLHDAPLLRVASEGPASPEKGNMTMDTESMWGRV